MPCTRVTEKPGPAGLPFVHPGTDTSGGRHGPHDTSHHHHTCPAHFWGRLVWTRTLVLAGVASIEGYKIAVDKARIAFGPEAMSRFSQIIEEVSLNLIDDGLTAELVRSDECVESLLTG